MYLELSFGMIITIFIENKNPGSLSEERKSNVNYKRIQSEEARNESSRSTYQLNDSGSEGLRRRVNFKHRGSVNFSYSFLPGDIMSRKKQKKLQDTINTLDSIMVNETESNIELKQRFIKEVVVK